MKKKQGSSWFRTILGYEGDGEGPLLRLCDIWEHTGFYFKKMDKDEVKVNLGPQPHFPKLHPYLKKLWCELLSLPPTPCIYTYCLSGSTECILLLSVFSTNGVRNI